jgi:asparagine synthetase B (glutamine-hydrolysing)
MCGILAALGLDGLSAEQARRLVLEASKRQRHRGPDDTSVVQLSPGGSDILSFERLLIIDPTSSGR